jgi:hypothetical protein
VSSPIFRRPSTRVFKGSNKKNYLIIGDAHLPFEHPKALEFLVSVQQLYQIPDENVICLGDLLDLYHFSKYPRGAEFPITPKQEIEIARKKIKEWAKAFPLLKICEANHESRLWKKAIEAELPSDVMRSIREIFAYPKTWEINEVYMIDTASPFLCLHGDGHGLSPITLTNNPRQFGMSVCYGHYHSLASIMHLSTQTLRAWSFNVGCLIDESSFAFEYGSKAKFKPSIGCGVIMSDGRAPLWIPLID